MAITPERQEPESQQEERQEQAKTKIRPGQLAPCWFSDQPNLIDTMTEKARNWVKRLVDGASNKDLAARRWEVETVWEMRLFDRGYQYLLPRRGGGWILTPFYGGNLTGRTGGARVYGHETNILSTYGEIITSALTRDCPKAKFLPADPDNDADVTAGDAGTRYARIFARENDLMDLQQQIVYYLRNDGRCVVVTDHILDAQRFGWDDPEPQEVPETEQESAGALAYVMRHGESEGNAEGVIRGRDPYPLDDRGTEEAAKAGDFLGKQGIGEIVSSPVERAAQTANQIGQKLGLPVSLDDRFASLDTGDVTGTPSKEAGDTMREHAENRDEPFPGGESDSDLDHRAVDGLSDAVQAAHQDKKPRLIVTHDSVISSLARSLHGEEAPPTDIVPPGGVAGIFSLDGGGLQMRQVYPVPQPAEEMQSQRGDPRGKEVPQAFGVLEHKVPINSMQRHDWTFCQAMREYDYALVRAMFPDYAKDINAGGQTGGENQLDRVARINVALALEASYVTGDSMVRDCTVQRTWFRPSAFMECDDEVRDELLRLCPRGMLAIYAGEKLVMVRNECMDDHVTLINALPGSGQNRMALMTKCLSLQKRLNNWMDLLNDFFIRTVPQRYVDSEIFDVNALRNNPQTPGQYIPFKRKQTNQRPVTDFIWVETTPTHQPQLPEFIQLFINDLPQLLTGAQASLFGADSNSDVAANTAMQRDQALARLAVPWHNLNWGFASIYAQALRLAARHRKTAMRMAGEPGDVMRVELADLRGNVLAFPEKEANFPESWVQRNTAAQEMIAAAATNPVVQKVLMEPANSRWMRDNLAEPGLLLPEADAYEMQMGEIVKLLEGEPIVQMGPMGQAVTKSTITPQDWEDHSTSAKCCADWMTKPEGRRYRNGSQQERLGFANVAAHRQEHIAMIQAPAQQPKMEKITTNFKDLPPTAAAQALQKHGLNGSPQEIDAARQ